MKLEHTYKFDVDGIGGVAFDGEGLWFTTFKGDSNFSLTRIRPADGQILKQLVLPTLTTGIAWDGSHIWGATKEGIKCLDPVTGAILCTLPLPDEWFISGLAWDGSHLWIGAHNKRKIHKVDPKTGKVLHSVNTERFVTGVTWVDQKLWHALWPEDADCPSEVREYEGDGTAAKLVLNYSVSGLCYDGKRLWCGDCRTATLRAVSIERAASHRSL